MSQNAYEGQEGAPPTINAPTSTPEGSKVGRGRPTKLNAEVHDKICKAIRIGAFPETAAALAGIDRGTFTDWLKRGQREYLRLSALDQMQEREHERVKDLKRAPRLTKEVRARLMREEEEERLLAERERIYMDFSRDVDLAVAEAEMNDLIILEKAARGGQEVVVKEFSETVTQPDGTVKTVQKKETTLTPPNHQVSQWRLERRHPKRWGRQLHEHIGPNGGPIQVESTSTTETPEDRKKRLQARREELLAKARLPSHEVLDDTEGTGE